MLGQPIMAYNLRIEIVDLKTGMVDMYWITFRTSCNEETLYGLESVFVLISMLILERAELLHDDLCIFFPSQYD